MCGIIGYLGDRAIGLSRILGAMASILYRAPDSTGAAWFGDEAEPLRVRKTVGALSRFVETQLSEGTHARTPEILASLWASGGAAVDPRELQKALLRWEHLPENGGGEGPEHFGDLIGRGGSPAARLLPGLRGCPEPRPTYRVESPEQLKALVTDGVESFDLPPLVLRSLLRKAVVDRLRGARRGSYGGIDEESAAQMLAELFRRSLRELELVIPAPEPEPARSAASRPDDAQDGSGRSLAGQRSASEDEIRRQFRRLLGDCPIALPADCSPDAVRWLFRLLDGALLSRLSIQPELREAVQKLFESRLHRSAGRPPWTAVYLAEKELNVFGAAAEAAWSYLRAANAAERVAVAYGENRQEEAPQQAADEVVLRFLCPPIIAHGRWALQSPVSDENAHPFLDAEGRRALVLNGQFSPAVEEELQSYLSQTGFRFRSENTTEYMSILWGHYHELFRYEQRRSRAIQAQVDSGLDGYNPGSQTIDYRVLSLIKNRSESELDALAFREAAARMVGKGGQIAVAGISLYSPRCLFVASHDRPVFIVRRTDTEEIMVVSDINAALGLFSQKKIQEKARELARLRAEYEEEAARLRSAGGAAEAIRSKREELKVKEELALQDFRVSVLPLEGEQKCAQIETLLQQNTVRRRITVTDFSGRPIEEVESFDTVLNPLPGEQVYASFFESHLKEVPERLHDMLSAYVAQGAESPRLNLRRRILVRRFGQRLDGLERLVLVGMGSSYHAGLMASTLCRELLPGIELLLLRPVEVEHALRLMEPEKDLVVLLSWSGTTADMVEFARELSASKISFIVVTNKPYSELGLFAWRSLGVVNLVSGEEVTFSAVKSTCSVLFGAQLLIVWLAALCGGGRAQGRLRSLATVPGRLEELAEDPRILTTLSRWAEQSSGCGKALVFDDLLYANTGREAAWKLEENGRATLCRALDYRDPLPLSLLLGSTEFLVVVITTASARLGEALELMKRLYLAGVRFYCFSYEHPQLEQMRFYCRDQLLSLPKMEDAFQPFVDLLVMYRFIQRLIEDAGKGVPGFPRNRVKSVTATRSRQRRFSTAAAELAGIRRDLEQLDRVAVPDFEETTLWERQAHAQWEREIYRHVHRTAVLLSGEDPFGALFREYDRAAVQRLSSDLFDELGEGGELLLLCCDKTSWAAGYEAAAVWGRLLGVPLRIFYRLEEMHRREAPLPVAVMASELPDRVILDQFRAAGELPVCWIGPELDTRYAQQFRRSLGCYILADEHPCAAYCGLYAGVLLLLTDAWERASSGKGKALRSVLCSASKAVSAVLQDGGLKDGIDSFWGQNREMETAFYISPPSGIGYVWEGIFDATGGALSLEHHVYGDSAHGPIAAVDPQVEEKYVRLRPRGEMVKLYGRGRVSEWERSYHLPAGWSPAYELPEETKKRGLFHAPGGWYLPVSEPGYEPSRDTMIILDASRARYYEQARDEVEVFACRYARMLLISQEAFHPADAKQEGAAGRTVLFPALHPGSLPIPDLLLPFVINAAAAAFAAGSLAARAAGLAARATRELKPVFTSREEARRLLGDRLLLLAEGLAAAGVGLGSLDHRHLAALEKLAPLVRAVEGAVRYEVRRFSSEKNLLSFVNRHGGERLQEIVDHFRLVHAQGLKFFLMRGSDPEGSGGAEQPFLDSEDRSWQEVFGMSWEALNTAAVQIGEGKNRLPLIEVPLLPAGKREGWLLRLFVRYREWDHSQSLEAQIASTLDAMQRGMMSLKSQSPRYLTMVSSFNESMQAGAGGWADWLIALLPRSWLLYKPAQELAAILADRAVELVRATGGGLAPLEQARRALGSVWRRLGKIEQEEEPSRWRSLFGKLEQQFRGGV